MTTSMYCAKLNVKTTQGGFLKLKNQKILSFTLIFCMVLTVFYPMQIYAQENSTKIFNGCKGSPVEISISGNSTNDFTFQCNDGCAIKVEKIGESSVSIGGFSSTSLSYALTFDKAGSHKVSAYNYQGQIADTVIFDIAENHTYNDGIVSKEATCDEDGEKTFTCNNCKNTYTEIIEKTGHSFSEWEISEEATALEDGAETRMCYNCKKEETRLIDKLVAFVNLEKKKLNLKVGKTYNLKISDNAYGDYAKNWKSSNKKIVKVNNKNKESCTIKAVKKGKCKVVVMMESGCKAICVVNVK